MRVDLVDKFNNIISLDLSTQMTFILGLSGTGKTSFIKHLQEVAKQDVWDKSGIIKRLIVNPATPEDVIPSLGTLIILDEDSDCLNSAWSFIKEYKDVWVILAGHGAYLQKFFTSEVGIAKIVSTENLQYLEYISHPGWINIPKNIVNKDMVSYN